MAASLSETLAQLRSFVEASINDIEHKYERAVRDKVASIEQQEARLESSNRQLQEEKSRLAAKVQELNEKLALVEMDLIRKKQELKLKDRWWESYKQTSQERFRVMKKTGTFPQGVMDNYVNKAIQELILARKDKEEKPNLRRVTRMARKYKNSDHSKRTRYQDIPAAHDGQSKTDAKPLREENSSDGSLKSCLDSEITQLAGQQAAGEVGLLVPDSDASIGLPSASSTPRSTTARDTQCMGWAPVARLPASDSQFPMDLSHSQPLSPTMPSNALGSSSQDQGGEDDSYSLLPPRQQWTDSGERASMLGVGTEGMGTLDNGHEPRSKQLNQGKRKRKDSWNAHKPACSRPAEFKVPEPVALRDLPKPAMQKKIVPTSSESQMETSAVDMFAEHGSRSADSATEDSDCAVDDDQSTEKRKCTKPTTNCTFESRKQEVNTYKYVEVVRKKQEREKLNGYACRECQEYFEGLGLPDGELRERLKKCSRHRAKFSPPPSTPPGFWNLSFPDTQTYIEKGYLQTEPQPRKKGRKKKSSEVDTHERPRAPEATP